MRPLRPPARPLHWYQRQAYPRRQIRPRQWHLPRPQNSPAIWPKSRRRCARQPRRSPK